MTPSCPGTYCPARDLCARYDETATAPVVPIEEQRKGLECSQFVVAEASHG